jgi:8-oxo-dGTP diphosphatase
MATVTTPIRAAGVVVLRTITGGREVLVVHRAARNDWSLPKGKLDADEHVLAATVRECEEEAGITPALRAPLPRMKYTVDGRPKVVEYWTAEVGVPGVHRPDDEVDETRWVPIEEVAELLTYPRDVQLVRDAAAAPATSPLVLVRHAQAVKRVDFDGDDDNERPLTRKGGRQADELVPLLAAYAPQRVHSSPAARCFQTVLPLAAALGVGLGLEPHLSETGYTDDPESGDQRVRDLLADPTPAVLCTHRPVLPALLGVVAEVPALSHLPAPTLDPALAPSSFIVVHRALVDGQVAGLWAVERHSLG